MIAFDRVTETFRDAGLIVDDKGHGRAAAQAPGHSPADRSVTITAIAGQVLVHSHSDPTADVLESLNIAPRDLFDEPRGARYDYPDGRQVHRSPEKKFRQSGNTRGTSLFHADRLTDATAVYVVEGEKDVLAAESIGLVATCTPMGAGKAHLVDLSPLHGKTVVIVADRDEPGHKHAEQVAGLLDGKAGVSIVEPKVGKDLADHVAAGLGPDDLVVTPSPDVETCSASNADQVAEAAEDKPSGRALQRNSSNSHWPATFSARLPRVIRTQSRSRGAMSLDPCAAARQVFGPSFPVSTTDCTIRLRRNKHSPTRYWSSKVNQPRRNRFRRTCGSPNPVVPCTSTWAMLPSPSSGSTAPAGGSTATSTSRSCSDAPYSPGHSLSRHVTATSRHSGRH